MASIASGPTETTSLIECQHSTKTEIYRGVTSKNENNGAGSVPIGAASTSVLDTIDHQGQDEVEWDARIHKRDKNQPQINKKFLFCIIILSHFMFGLSISLLAPFYPQVALKKGMSLTLIGLVFSLFPFIGFVLSPVLGSHLTRIGPRFLVISGMFVGGSCNILYGTLDKCPNGTPFIVTSLVCRFAEGIGMSAYCTAMFAITATQFSQRVGSAIASAQTASEVGLMLGPGVGGFLYELGGFGTPFYVTGSVIVLNSMILYWVVPEVNIKPSSGAKDSKRALFSNGLTMAAFVSLAMSALGFSFLESTLSNHLQPLNFSTSTIGLIFTIIPVMFVICSPIFGILIDSKGLEKSIMTLGQFIFGLGFYLVGPAALFPFLHLETWTVVVGLAFIGTCFPACFVPNYKCAFEGAVESGWEDVSSLSAVVSSFTCSLYFFGTFAGLLLGNFLVEQGGYRFGYTVIGTFNIAASVFSFVIIFLYRRIARKSTSNFG